jgi:osmoprotectant transport system ATP-binding protein
LWQGSGQTVVFVTHDIEEAVKIGDRIAILNIGGLLEQYDTPSEILGHPATEFVASFVGGDRAIKQLKVTTIDQAQLDHPQTVTPEMSLDSVREILAATGALSVPVVDSSGALHGRVRAKDAEGDGVAADRLVRVDAWVDRRDTLEHALANTLLSDDGWIGVLDGDRYLGVLTPDGVYRSLRAEVDKA